MNIEKLEIGNKLLVKIKDTKETISALNSPYFNCIRAINYWGDKETTKCINLDRDGELFALILDYYTKELDKLTNEFNEL